MPNTSRTTYVSTSRSTTKNTTRSTNTYFNTSHNTTTSYTTTYSTSRGTSRTTTYNTYYNTSHTTTYNTEWSVSTSHQTTAQTTTTFNTTYYTTLTQNTTIFTNTNTVVSTAVSSGSVTTTAPVTRSTTFFRPKEVSPTNLMLNLDARVSAGSTAWKDQSGNSRDATVSGTVGVSDRCVALYNFHSDATDLTGNNTGTESNITYGSGKHGQGAVFNGSTSTIDINATATKPIDFSSEVFSVSLWIKVNSLSHENTFLGKYGVTANAATHRTILMKIDTSGRFVVIENDGSSIYTQTSTATISTNTYMFFAYTRNGSTSKIYINNNSAESQSRTNTIKNGSTQELTIGGVRTGVTDLDGKIDQVRIFNKELSSSEITQLYNENSSTFKKVDIFNDATDGHYNLDGTDSFYMTHFITDQNFTIGGWFYRNSSGGSAGYESLWAQGYSPSVRCQIYGADGSASGNRLYIYLHNGSSSASYDTGVDIPTGEWFHLMKTYDLSAGTVKVYLNSALKKTQSTITGSIYSSGNSDAYFRIAKNSTNNNGYINGKISQVRVYDSVLTDAQIIDDYSTHDYLYI